MKPFYRLVTLVLAIFCPLAAHAAATPRFFDDVTQISPNGRYRLDAKSPDNARKPTPPFQSGFVYTLTDLTTSKQLWTRTQPEREGAPLHAWVHDDGRSVVRTASDELLFFTAAAGGPAATVRIRDHFSKDEQDKHVHLSTAGERWSTLARWYILDQPGETCFVLRPWWGRRLIFTLKSGALVPDAGALHDAAVQAESADILRILTTNARLKAPPLAADGRFADAEFVHKLMSAIYFAGIDAIKDAAAPLQSLQTWDYSGSSTGGGYTYADPYPDGQVLPFNYDTLTIRGLAQTALRRLGLTPQALPSTRLTLYSSDGKPRTEAPNTPAGNRADRVTQITKGMSALQVLQLVGAPDFIDSSERAWQYDIDAPEPYTITLTWKGPLPAIDTIARTTPPVWKKITRRDDPE